MNLEIGSYYLNALGEIIKINGSNKSSNTFLDTSSNVYESNGVCVDDMIIFDIIAEIPKELHWFLMYNIKNFHTNGNVRKKLKRKYNNYINCCVSKNKELK